MNTDQDYLDPCFMRGISMKIIKVLIIAAIACIILFAVSSCKNTETESASVKSTQSTPGTTSQETSLTTASVSESRPEDFVDQNLIINEDRTHVTGRISDYIQIDADLVATVDPMSPGSASSYTATFRTFSEPQRLMFVQPGWTLVDSEFRPAHFEYDDEYFDVYEDESGNRHHCNVVTTYTRYYTPVGRLISQMEVPAQYLSPTDFEFATEQEAFEIAKSFAETYGYHISEYHRVYRLPYEELELSSKMIDQSDVDAALPQGWTSEQDAYKFMLFIDIDGLPTVLAGSNPLSAEYSIQTNCWIEIIVTPKGVEYAYFYFQYDNTNVQSTGEICDIEEALNLFSQEIISENAPQTPPLKIYFASLGYLGQWEPSTGAVLLRPYWVFGVEETGAETLGSQLTYYVDALSKTVTNEQSFSEPEI